MAKLARKMSLSAIDGHLAYSNGQVWAYYLLPTTKYEYQEDNRREATARNIDDALAALVAKGTHSVEGVLCVTSTPLNVETWSDNFKSAARQWDHGDNFEPFVDKAADHLYTKDFSQKEVYLGILLGGRGNSGAETPVKSAFGFITSRVDSMLGFADRQVEKGELKYWRKKAEETDRILRQSHLGGQPVKPNQIAMLFKKPLWPAMEVPPTDLEELQTWGSGDLLSLASSDIERHRKFMKITQPHPLTGEDMVGYRATLCFSKFPEVMEFPHQEPWIHWAALLGSDLEIYSRFSIEPALKVRKAVERKAKAIIDEAENAARGETGDIPLDIQERLVSARQLEHEVSRENTPWVHARHRAIVTAHTEEDLREKVQAVVSHYRSLSITLEWPTGMDQEDLFLEAQPADRVRVTDYLQRQSLSIISGGMPTANSSVGDLVLPNGKGWVGPYLGETTSRIREPVFFSPQVALSHNNPPGVLVTGSPGGGKSFLGFTIICQLASQNVWGVYIDPKADARNIDKIKDIGRVTAFDLRTGNDGILDPFTLADDVPSQSLMAIQTLTLLLGSLTDKQVEVIYEVVDRVISNEQEPSLDKVVDYLLAEKRNSTWQALGKRLNLIRQMEFARLAFSKQTSELKLRVEDGLTIITMLGIKLPSANTESKDYTVENRLAVSIMYLLTTFTRNLMVKSDKNHPKFVGIDEAWAVTSTTQGAQMIDELLRMGRSMNTNTLLISQNSGEFQARGLMNSIATHFAFKVRDPDEAEMILSALNLEAENETNKNTLLNLNTGECLMRDNRDRVARVQVERWNQEWSAVFESNPYADKEGKEVAA